MPRAAPPGSRASPSAAATPVRRGMGKGRGEGRRVRGRGVAPPPRLAPGGGGGVAASGVCPSPRPALPATSLEVGPRVRGGLPRAPPPHPTARGAGHDRLSPARGPRAARVLRSRLAGCAARRAAASPSRGRSPRPVASRAAGPGPVCLGRSSSVVPPLWARRAVAGRLPAPLRASGPCPAPAPTPHASRRLVCLRPGSPALSTPPRPLGAKLPVGAPAPCPLPSVVVVGGKGARERGRGQGGPPTPGGWGREAGGGPAEPGPYGTACEGAAVGKGLCPVPGGRVGPAVRRPAGPSGRRSTGARRGPPVCHGPAAPRPARAAAGGDAAVGGPRRGGGAPCPSPASPFPGT